MADDLSLKVWAMLKRHNGQEPELSVEGYAVWLCTQPDEELFRAEMQRLGRLEP